MTVGSHGLAVESRGAYFVFWYDGFGGSEGDLEGRVAHVVGLIGHAGVEMMLMVGG